MIISPSSASFTGSLQVSSNRIASDLVNSLGMCCTTKIADFKSSGSAEIIDWSTLGPPVDEPTTTTLVAALGAGIVLFLGFNF